MIKLFTHTDLDGIGCAILAKEYFEKNHEVDVEYCDYDNINERVNKFLDEYQNVKYDLCFITDISVNEETAKRIDNIHDDSIWFLFDHHATALELNKYKWCEVKIANENGVKTSGTELFYDQLVKSCGRINKALENFVTMVRDYDTWNWTTYEGGERCKRLNDLYYIYGKDDFIVWCRTRIMKNEFPAFSLTDISLLNMKQKEIDNYIELKKYQIKRLRLFDYHGGVVFAERFISELGNKLAQMNPDLDFIAIINLSNQTVSYRTISDSIDLGKEIASKLGGGGHAKASGSPIPDEVVNKIIPLVFNMSKLINDGVQM